MTERALTFGRHVVEVSRPEKVLFPADGITKGDLIDYYARVAELMLPHLEGRPLAMERFPDGLKGERIFQKDVPDYFPDWVKRVTVKKERGTIDQVVCNTTSTLVYLANQACITPHAFLSRLDKPDRPDQLIFDLDPPEDAFDEARAAAGWLKEILDRLGLISFVKTTGGKGLHVTVPLDRGSSFDEVRAFAREVADVLADREPERITTEQRKAKRRGRVFMDVMRNAYAQTAVPPFAVRARNGAPVAMPLDWSELDDPKLRPSNFTIRTAFRRLGREGDPWEGIRRQGRTLRGPRRKLEALKAEG